jgi:hypothetical protein
MANGLNIMNRGNRPTFVASNRQEFVAFKIVAFYVAILQKIGM